jgi:hypothetical protein
MNRQTIYLGLGLLVLLALGGASLYPKSEVGKVEENKSVPAEDVPEQKPEPNNGELKVGLGQSVSGLGVAIAPIAVVEDSRCPIDAQCVWSGTIKVRATLASSFGTSEQVFELGKAVTTEGEVVTLVEVLPYPRAGEEIDPSRYIFHFQITKRSVSATDTPRKLGDHPTPEESNY